MSKHKKPLSSVYRQLQRGNFRGLDAAEKTLCRTMSLRHEAAQLCAEVLGPVNTTSGGGDGGQFFSVRGARSEL